MTGVLKNINNLSTLEISESGVEAFITITPPPGTPWPDSDYILSILSAEGITDSVIEDEVKRLIADRIAGSPVCIARGEEAVLSVNGWIERLYEKNIREIDPQGDETIDHRERSMIRTVSRGERIIKIHPSVQGKDGRTVKGAVIPAGNASDVKVTPGQNSAFDPVDESYIVATDNGAVTVTPDYRVNVLPLLEVKGNIDYSVGNVDFTGSLIIRGDILSGFKVKTTGSIQVFGVIEDSEVYAGGDIIARGCAGGSRGFIKAGGSISIIYAENCNLQAGQDITAQEYLINCVSHADGRISVVKKRGVIAGGTSVAGKSIEVNNAGNSTGLRTVLSAGFSAELRQNLKMIDDEQTKNINSLGQINTALKKISRISMIKKELPPNIVRQTKELVKMKELIEEKINAVLEKQERVLTELSAGSEASIRVAGTVFPGTVINFLDIQRIVREEIRGTVFRVEGGALQSLPLK